MDGFWLMSPVTTNGYNGDEMGERKCIRDSGKTPRRYGSTSKHMTRNEILVKHLISTSDTLQGIALKYGVTTEQIRRANKLWASDSLFLREHLLIPVSVDSPYSTDSSLVNSTSASFDSISSPPVTSPTDEEESSFSDFLAKMDSSIATVKKEIKKKQGTSEFLGEDYNNQRHRFHQATSRSQNSRPVSTSSILVSLENQRPSTSDIQNLPKTVVMTHGKKVKTSMLRLQKEQDDLFQL